MILLILFYGFYLKQKEFIKPYVVLIRHKAAQYDFINYLNSTNILEKGFKVFKMILSKLV